MDAKEIRRLRPKLVRFLGGFTDCFSRKDTREHLGTYVEGQLSNLERKTAEPIALHADVAPWSLQNFLSVLTWDHEAMRDRVAEIVVRDLDLLQVVGPDRPVDDGDRVAPSGARVAHLEGVGGGLGV